MKKVPLNPEHRAGQKKIRKMLAAGLPLAALMSGLAGCDSLFARTAGDPPRPEEPEVREGKGAVRGKMPAEPARPAVSQERINPPVAGRMMVEPPGPAVHVVKKGDTLGSIARKYGITVGKLKKLNGFTDQQADRLTVGQKIKLK